MNSMKYDKSCKKSWMHSIPDAFSALVRQTIVPLFTGYIPDYRQELCSEVPDYLIAENKVALSSTVKYVSEDEQKAKKMAEAEGRLAALLGSGIHLHGIPQFPEFVKSNLGGMRPIDMPNEIELTLNQKKVDEIVYELDAKDNKYYIYFSTGGELVPWNGKEETHLKLEDEFVEPVVIIGVRDEKSTIVAIEFRNDRNETLEEVVIKDGIPKKSEDSIELYRGRFLDFLEHLTE